jgi:serine/threonine-protein kinase
LDEYTKAILAALEKQGIKVDESTQNAISGKPGHKITFSPPSPATQTTPVSLKIMQTWTIIDNKVYLLSFSAESSKFTTYLPTVQKMLDSFQIQPPSI